MLENEDKVEVLIIGAGMAGLGAGVEAQRNGLDSLILETNDAPGGLCRNTTVAGCDFDYGPKILLLDDPAEARDILSFLDDNYECYPMVEKAYLKEYGLVSFPLQRHLVELPAAERQLILSDLEEVHKNPIEVRSYRDWLTNCYGRYFCEKVLFPYEEKKWQTSLDSLDYSWALSRPVKVDLDEVILGSKQKLNPNRNYYYPKQGNISALSNSLAKKAGRIQYNSGVSYIDLDEKYVVTNGRKYSYDYLVSSAPLDYEVTTTHGLPNELRDKHADLLKWLSIRVFNLVFRGNYELDGTAIYFPEKDFIFRRVSVLENLCPALRRNGLTPISVEVSLNTTAHHEDAEVQLRNAMDDLRKIPQFQQLGDLADYEILEIPNAYPLQIRGMRDYVKELHDYYEKFGVYHCGRGGNFDYCNSDVAFLQGKKAIHTLLESMDTDPKEPEMKELVA